MLVSYDVKSLFTRIPVEESFGIWFMVSGFTIEWVKHLHHARIKSLIFVLVQVQNLYLIPFLGAQKEDQSAQKLLHLCLRHHCLMDNEWSQWLDEHIFSR